jgi:DNA primase
MTQNEDGPIVVVEGFKACMWLWQAGITNVVALMTKHMSWEQRWMLHKMTDSLILMLDNDAAGVKGTVQICKELEENTTDIRLVEYDAAQPTDVPLEELQGLIESARDHNLLALF